MELGYTVQTNKSVDEAVAAVEKAVADNNFRVLHIHHVDHTLREKGFNREPYKIIEVCNGKYASQVLEQNINIGLFLPCKVNVYTEKGQTYISGMRTQLMAELFKDDKIKQVADEVGVIVEKIVDSAK